MKKTFPVLALLTLTAMFHPADSFGRFAHPQNPGKVGTAAEPRAIRVACFDPAFVPREELLPAIYDSVARASIGTLAEDEVVDCTLVFMNHWFVTDIFSGIARSAGFGLNPTGRPSRAPVRVWELHFRSEVQALSALDRMDTWGLRNTQFFPPAHWFWLYFRGRILFLSCLEMPPFEGAYKQFLDIVLREVHRQRQRGNLFTPPYGR